MGDRSLRDLALELNSTAIHLVRRLRRTDAQLGVPAARLSALSVLVFGGPRTLSELAAAEQVSGPTMTEIVRGLERMGLARGRRNPSDARSTVVTATAKGRRVMHRGRDLRVEQLADRLRLLPDADVDVLARAVRVLRRLEREDDCVPAR